MLEGLSSKLRETFSRENAAMPDSEMNALENKLITSSNNTARALSEMISMKVGAVPSSLRAMPINEIPNILDSGDSNTTILLNKITGTANSAVIVSASQSDILIIADILLHKERGYFKSISNENISVIKEFSNILAGYYVSALNELFGTKYGVSPSSLPINPYRSVDKDPYIIIESLGFSFPAAKDVCALAFCAEFYIAEYDARIKAALLLKKEDAKKIL